MNYLMIYLIQGWVSNEIKLQQSSTSRSLCWIKITALQYDSNNIEALTNYANFIFILPRFFVIKQ